MADNFASAPVMGDPGPENGKGGLVGFFSTTVGRIVLGSVVLLLLLGALAAIVFLFVLEPQDTELEVTVPPAGSVVPASQTEQSDEESATAVSAKPLSSTFVFRDVFEPTVKPTIASSDTTGTGGSSTGGSTAATETGGDSDGDGVPNVPPDTLFLLDVSTVDGVVVANLIWNGETFAAAEGDTLGDTPWQVLSISGDTVVMLYGDTRVTLVVGQGVGK